MTGWGLDRWHRALVRAGLALLPLTILAVGASPASAVQTTVSFEGLSVGTEVTSQLHSQGIEFGKEEAFGQNGKPGNCGAPTVGEEAVPPKYALLAVCVGAINTLGTFGELVNHPRGTLSMQVRDVESGPPAPEVILKTYDAEGNELAGGHVASSSGSWEPLSAVQEGGKNSQISYFSISTPTTTASKLAIRAISFEAPGEEPAGGGAGGGPAGSSGSTPPSASVGLVTPNPAPGQLLTLTGAGSQAGSGHIISYDWDLNGDGKIDTSTATNPIVHLILAPGPHTVGLTVTNSNGEKSSSKLGLTMPAHIELPPPPDGGEGTCEPTLEVGDARLIAECIQKVSGGGYVIETKQLALNGMDFQPQGGGYGIFKINTVKDFAIDGTQTLLSGPNVSVELLNTPIGDVALGGRDLESEPIQLTAHSGLNQLKIPFNHGLRGPRGHAAEAPTKTLLMGFGVGKPCTGKEKNAGCCPQGNTACATLPGNFPLVGQVVVYLTNKGQALLDVQVGLELKGIFEATGALEIEADPQSGINLNSLVFTIPEAGLEKIFQVKKAKFAYYFPSAPEESKRDTWQAEGEIVFGPLGEPSLEAELAFKHGQFHSGSLVFGAPPPGVPIYPGIFLNKLGGSIGVEPFAFGGTLGAKVAEALELTLSFKYREQQGEELGFFGGQGQLELDEDKIATLAADVYSDGYIDAKLSIDLKFPPTSSPVVQVGGNIGFWDETEHGRWQAEGMLYLKLWEISAEVAGLVNNEYVAGCGSLDGFGGQARYKFSDGSVSGGIFIASNCSDQLKQYKQTQLVKHSGGFVEESLRFPARDPLATAAGVDGDTFKLPAKQLGQELRFTSSSGTPVVTLISPSGQTYTTPTGPGHISVSGHQFIAAVAPDHDQVLVLLAHPQGGVWRAQAAPGSPPLTKLEVAGDVAPASVHVKVHHGHASSWSLAYKIANFVPGTSVQFVERGRDSTHVLGTVKRAAGTLRFVPEDALGRSRKIVAYLLDTEGAPQRVLTVGSYRAPGALRGGRVKGLRIVRRGVTALVSWRATPGTRLYRVLVHGSDGRLMTLLRRPGARSVLLANVLPFESFTATVAAEGGPNLLRGPTASARLPAVKVKTAPAKKHKGRKGKR
jgi:PKD repeat protein